MLVGPRDLLRVRLVHTDGISERKSFQEQRSVTSLSPERNEEAQMSELRAGRGLTAGSFEYSLKYLRFFGKEE